MVTARHMAVLAFVFVCAQFFATAHAAAYGDSKHFHHGHPCIIATAVKKSADMDVAEAPQLAFAQYDAWQEPVPEATPHTPVGLTASPIRGPPIRL